MSGSATAVRPSKEPELVPPPGQQPPEFAQWYYSDSSHSQKGPVAMGKILDLIKSGEIKKNSLCWKKGMAVWEEMRKVEELKNVFSSFEEDIKRLESLTGAEPAGIADGDKKRRSRSKKLKKKWKVFPVNANVYVSGLPPEITEDELGDYFSKCGIIRRDPLDDQRKVKIYKDAEGTLKGDGLVSYLKEESVQLAIDMLDDSFMSPAHKIHVEKAEFTMKGDVFVAKKSQTDETALKKITKRKIAKAKDQSRELCWDDEQEAQLAGKAGLRIVILKPMFDPAEGKAAEDEDEFYKDLGREVGLECEKTAGPIEKLTVFEGSESGAVAIKFKGAEAAARCIAAMGGRFFGGRLVECEYFDGTDYRARGAETEGESERRVEEFGKWLEGWG